LPISFALNIYSLQVALCQAGVVVVAFVLHARAQSNHAKIVGIRDTVDIAREPDGKRRQGNTLCQTSASG
jgi:hypothetical protein